MTDFIETLKAYWWLVTGPAALAAATVFLWLKSQFVTKKDFEKHADGVNEVFEKIAKSLDEFTDETEARLTDVEATIRHLPNRETFQDLKVQVAKQGVMIKAIADMQKTTAAGVSRIEDYMMKAGGAQQ